MTPSSCKAKGRTHQQAVVRTILEINPELEADDVRSTSMGNSGEDLQLSPAARRLVPYQIECKSRAKMAIYADYAQAATHGKHQPLVIVRQNHHKALAVVDAQHFFELVRRATV